MALTSGPSQPEVQSFEPVTTNQMVDPFTGDFTYNIPLFNLPGPDGGYPFNLAYHSGIGMDQEASWVGLGWSLNPGVINRDVRNLPDDFDGTDEITITEDLKTNWTVGRTSGANLEPFGGDPSKGGVSLSTKLYYNNYKGVGYGIGAGISHRIAGTGASLGLNISLDTQEGVGASPSLSIRNKTKTRNFTTSISTGYNSRIGLTQTSLGLSTSKQEFFQIGVIGYGGSIEAKGSSGGGSSSISIANNSYSPAVSTVFTGKNINISFKNGADVGGILGSWSIGGFYNSQKLKNKGKPVSYAAVGYLNLEEYDLEHENGALSDFGREKDGMIHRTSELLASPTFTYDAYTVLGQGIGNTYRPFRSDLGIGTNQFMKSKTKGGNIGYEHGIPAPLPMHSGLEIGYNWSKTTSGKWKDNLDAISDKIGFKTKESNQEFEPYYFKSYGEHTTDDNSNSHSLITSEDAVFFDIYKQGSGIGKSFEASNELNDETTYNTISTSNNKRSTRRPKGANLIPITNAELLKNNSEVLPEYDIKYHIYGAEQNITQLVDIPRNTKENHIAGYTALNNSGQRYIYGLPAYNKRKKEVRFSLDPKEALLREGKKNIEVPLKNDEINYKQTGTDKRFYEMETPAYAHSYLLTSILGADYVDIDNNGPSENDLGYWVKFNYTKTSDNYKWRAPFSGANFIEGYKTSSTDDQGSYVYGEKEIWHVGTVETKTHIAEFILADRSDAHAAHSEIQNNNNLGEVSKKLTEIHIYTKAERYKTDGTIDYNAVPIKTVHLNYTNDLCKGIPNSSVGEGKLTLKELWFTYRNNNRGALNKYTFDYLEDKAEHNPNYNEEEVDKWGNYQPNHLDYKNQDNPYVHQFGVSETEQNRRASVWNLRTIGLPSGGRMEIDYEADRYAYIQDEVAMQMTPIKGISWLGGNKINYPKGGCIPCDHNKRIYFKLEHSVPVSEVGSTASQQEKFIEENYLPLKEKDGYPSEVYFKIKSVLTNENAGLEEYVGGYSKIITAGLEAYGANSYSHAWIELDYLTIGKANGKSKVLEYHPFQVAAWQHIRTNQPNLMYEVGNSLKKKDKLSKVQAARFAKSLGSIFPEISRIFRGVYDWMLKKGWGNEINLKQSFLRLRTPDKEKFGGGCRVREISITDNWNNSTTNESSETYGQRYSYTTIENGKTISSGVAAYEPVIGGDEIALRKPVHYALHTTLKTGNNMYSELPVNENLYPGPQVGYSKVTVMSLNTAKQEDLKLENQSPTNTSTTGKVVNQYYTAKDFPVKTDYTELDFNGRKTKMKHHLVIPVPGIGSTTLNKLAATQGYSIVLNDMHGKMKSVTNYGQDNNGDFINNPVSSVEYIYQTNTKGELDNKVTIINKDNASLVEAEQESSKEMGVDIDFITDMRKNMTISGNIGLSANVKFYGVLPTAFPWPSISYSESQLKTVVTNKVIHKSGILIKTVATDGQSVVATENLKFDPLTGEALLTKTTNNYDEGIYNYSMPARWAYQEMGAAYENIGLKFKATVVYSPNSELYEVSLQDINIKNKLTPGDEYIGEYANTKKKFTYVQNQNGILYFKPISGVGTGLYTFTIVRSGKRNHLGVKAANYVTLGEDPTINRETFNCVETTPILVPKKEGEVNSLNRNIASAKIDKVLSASATTFTNQWVKDFREYRENGASNYTASLNANPFATGEKGIWSAHKTYTYVDDRQQTVDSPDPLNDSDVKLAEDGIFNDVSLYNWDYTTLTNCNSKWKMGSEITKMNPYSLEIENRDVLGRYSAALYGYGGRQATAVAANAKYSEIGFESFEEYKENQNIDQFNATTGNLSFYNNYSNTGGENNNGEVKLQEQFDVLLGQTSVAVLDLSIEEFNTLGVSVGDEINLLAIADRGTGTIKSEQVLQKVTINSFDEIVNQASKYNGKIVISYTANNLFENNLGRIWTGKIGFYKTIGLPNSLTNTSSISNKKAHTGKHSLHITGVNEQGVYRQSHLNLIPGKKYELSTWVSKKLNHYSSLAAMNINIQVNFLNKDGIDLGSSTQSTASNIKGKTIEGWQKLDFSFIPPAGTAMLQFTFNQGNIEYIGGIPYKEAFFDDIRIFPSTGLMKSHVYDPTDLKLRATLDDNNYATFYYYDESGALFLVKQETAEGIKTIQESRGHLQE